MLCIVYYAGADLFLVDRAVLDMPAWVAILISLASLSVGWLLYDNLCKSRLAANPTLLMVLLFLILVAMAWGYTHVFTGRAALLHLGAFTATIMSANVFLVIIPNQEIVVADLKAGRTPDPKYGAIAKLRSTHNNYLTLPVLFLMLSNHYPLAFATEYNWLIASLVFLMGVTIRHYFNTMHAAEGQPNWTWAATAIIFVIIMWLSTAPGSQREELASCRRSSSGSPRPRGSRGGGHGPRAVLDVPHRRAVLARGPPRAEGRDPRDRRRRSPRTRGRSTCRPGRSHAMPPGNVTEIEPAERKAIVDWYRAAVVGQERRLGLAANSAFGPLRV